MTNSDVSKLNLLPNDFGKLRTYCSEKSVLALEKSLKVLESGRAPTPTFPLYGKRDDSIVNQLVKLLEEKKLSPWLIEYEKSRLEKWGPQGGVPKWDDLKDLFFEYQTSLHNVKFIDEEILSQMKREYAKLHCTKKGVSDTLKHLIKSDKIESRAAGWNTFDLRKTDKEAQKEAVRLAQNGEWLNGVGYVFSRYYKKKNRLFMPMPFSSMLKQAQYYTGFLGNIQMDLLSTKSNSPYIAWADKVGFEKCFQFMEDEIKKANISPNETLAYFSNDFKSMDTRTGTQQYDRMFIPIMQAAFNHTADDDIAESMRFTTTAPIYSPSGTMVGDHGTASGAEVTNGGEGTCNDYFQRRFLKWLRKLLPKGWRLISRRFNGDDSALVFAITISVEYFFEKVKEALQRTCEETGFDIQFDKLDMSTEFGKYCQNLYYYDRANNKIKWFYPSVLALNSIIHPEHEYTKAQWDKDYRDLDIIQKLDNLANHPIYTDIVDYVANGLKFPLLGSSEQETKRILSKYDEYRKLQTLGERYNRTDYDISTSPTVRYVLSKR